MSYSKYYDIDDSVYKRFEQKNDMFCRYLWDNKLNTYRHDFSKKMLKHINLELAGYSHVDYAFSKASWTAYNRFPFAFSWRGDTSFEEDWYGYKLRENKYKVTDLREFTNRVKKVSKFFGASLVGVTDANDKWIYKTIAKRSNGKLVNTSPVNLPTGVNNAIVLAIKMEPVSLSTTPALPACAATGLGYSKIAFVISCLGEFIRNLGYRAIQCGNDTALSIPMAIDAGLGALGRNGLLVTPQYGSNVRIGKILTDLPLLTDKPDNRFILKLSKYCKNCLLCAEACEKNAISFGTEPVYQGETISNNHGVKKYYINPEKCFEFWTENNSDCSECVTICPFSRIKKRITAEEFWK